MYAELGTFNRINGLANRDYSILIMAIPDLSPNKGALLFLVISALIGTSSSYKILLIPVPYTSPVQEAKAIASKLLAHNHTVVLVMPKSLPKLEELKEKFDVIEYKTKYPDIFTQPPSWIIDGYTGTQNQYLRHIAKDIEPFCTNPLEDDEYIQRINATKFDLAIIEADMQRCNMLILHNLGIPYVSFVLNEEQWRWKATVLPSFVPTMFLGIFTERMTLLERMRNLYAVLDWALRPGVIQYQDSFLEKYAPSITYDMLYGESLLFLVNSDFLIDYPRPVMPNEVFVGGLTTKPAARLPDDLLEFADNAYDGLIVITFGTIDMQMYEPSSVEKFVAAFHSLPEYRFVWRYAEELTESRASKLPGNVVVMKWIPQNDLLGHRNTKLVITHCGSNTQFEAIFHGVPMLCFPKCYDQPYNARSMRHMGYGRFLDFKEFTTDQLTHEIKELIQHNQTYRANIQKASAIFNSRPDTPLERTLWWVEYVIKHGGKHLRSHALDMKWREYWMIDILTLFVIVPLMILTSLITWCLCAIGRRLVLARGKIKNH